MVNGIELNFSKLKENGSFNSVAWYLELIWQEMLQWSAVPPLYLFTVQNLSELRGVSTSVRQCPPGTILHYRGSGSCSSETSFLVWMNEFATDADGCAVCAPPQPAVLRASPGERVTPDPSLETTEPNNSYRHFTKLSSSLLISISRFRLIWRVWLMRAGVWPLPTAPHCCTAPAPLRTAAASFVYKPPSWSRPQLSYWPLLRILSVNICLYKYISTKLNSTSSNSKTGTPCCSSGTPSVSSCSLGMPRPNPLCSRSPHSLNISHRLYFAAHYALHDWLSGYCPGWRRPSVFGGNVSIGSGAVVWTSFFQSCNFLITWNERLKAKIIFLALRRWNKYEARAEMQE